MYTFEFPQLCKSGVCILCQKCAKWICQRCMDFYCSQECQRKDWQRHRYICFAMPGLLPAMHFGIESMAQCNNNIPSPGNLNTANLGTSNEELLLPGESYGMQKLEIVTKNASSLDVILLGFISSNVCVVRPLRDTDANTSVMKKIDTRGRRATVLNNPPTIRSVALCMLNGAMSRVEVLSIQDERNIKVLFYDYGITAAVDLCDLRVAPEDILDLPRFSITVNLRNVSMLDSDEDLSFLQTFEGMECVMRNCSKVNGDIEVELVSLCENKIINQEIEKHLKMSHTKVTKGKCNTVPGKQLADKIAAVEAKDELLVDLSQDISFQSGIQPILKSTPSKCISDFENKPVLTPPFEIHVFKQDMANFKAIVLDTSALNYGYIGCIAEADLKYLVSVQEYLTKYKEKEHFYSPKLHEYCLARFENEWYRARVVKVIDETRYVVVYLDFTNESILTSKDIRRYPDDLNGPCRTNLCLLDGLPKSLKYEHIQFLKKEITTESKILIDRVKEVVQQVVVIQCNNVIKKMIHIGLK
ncbi:protein vreteno-like [Eurosta solidaginis]|uniref:protein vreteno-like n=1 Tax=Eurosta solidaginis TaxID=178769 RepID=UPI0035311C20